VSTKSEEVHLNSVFDFCQETFLRSRWKYVLHGPPSSEHACCIWICVLHIHCILLHCCILCGLHYSLEQDLSCKSNSPSSSQEIPHLLMKLIDHYPVSLLVLTTGVTQMTVFDVLTPCSRPVL